MSKIQSLRAAVMRRLTAAAEDILGLFERSIAEYEEELNRQRRLLEADLRPASVIRRSVALISSDSISVLVSPRSFVQQNFSRPSILSATEGVTQRNSFPALAAGKRLATKTHCSDTQDVTRERNHSAARSAADGSETEEMWDNIWSFTRERNRSAAACVNRDSAGENNSRNTSVAVRAAVN